MGTSDTGTVLGLPVHDSHQGAGLCINHSMAQSLRNHLQQHMGVVLALQLVKLGT